MIDKMVNFVLKNKKSVIIASSGIALIIVGIIAWEVIFSKYYIFKQEESKFLNTVKRYYEYHSQYLPKNGETRKLTLQNLYDQKLIDDLLVPKSKKMCSTDSFVLVINKDGKYDYITYLECGKYKSKVDHVGPEIVLNGGNEITISLGSKYEELGVESVKDNKDGNIDVKNVKIDSSKVNTKKAGQYEVTYTVSDSMGNKTVLKRKVNVLANLTEVVKKDTNNSYYTGRDVNNYLLFSGILFRIVGVNSDGSIKIITDSNVASVNYGSVDTDYDSSNIKSWLNNYFYSNIVNGDKYVVADSKWCIDEVSDEHTTSDDCKNYSTGKVGLLTLSELNRTFDSNNSYLDTVGEYWLITKKNSQYVYTHLFANEGVSEIAINGITGVRPVLNLNSNIYITSGDGTFKKPYRIGDYKAGKANDLLKERYVGEYVNYSGMLFKISGFDKDGNIKMISLDFLANGTKVLYSKYADKMMFNPKEEGNIAYQLNNEYIDYFDTSLVQNHSYTIYKYDSSTKYSDWEKASTFKAKLSIPSSFEMFSAIDSRNSMLGNYWLLDYVDDSNALITNSSNGKSFNITTNFIDKNAFKLEIYIKNTAKVTKGNGTYSNPFYIK